MMFYVQSVIYFAEESHVFFMFSSVFDEMTFEREIRIMTETLEMWEKNIFTEKVQQYAAKYSTK